MNGAKGKGYVTTVLNKDAGQSVFTWSCNEIGDLEPLYKHESIGAILFQIWKIMVECPELFPPDDPSMTRMPTVEEQIAFAQRVLADPALRGQLVAIWYDDGCHFKYSIMLRAVGKLAEGKPRDSEEAVFYRRLMLVIICVDRMHFKNHLKTDKFCQENTNPELFKDVLKGENSEAAEQTFRSSPWVRHKVRFPVTELGSICYLLPCLLLEPDLATLADLQIDTLYQVDGSIWQHGAHHGPRAWLLLFDPHERAS